MARFALTALLIPLATACDGGDGSEWTGNEICDNGIDDNANQLADCDDPACGCPPDYEDGGDNGDDDDPVSVNFSTACEDVVFSSNDCRNVLICSFTVINDTEDDGFVDASCDNRTGSDKGSVFFDNVEEGRGNQPSLSNSQVSEESEHTIVLRLDDCDADQEFTVDCRLELTAGNETARQEWSFTGIFQQ